jgi:hypothetical protein
MRKATVSLRFLFVALSSVAIVACVLGYRHRWLMTRDELPQTQWPQQLDDLLADLHDNGIETGQVDVRARGMYVTYYWKMSATDRAIAAHVDRFQLAEVTNNGIEVRRVHEFFPPAWTWPERKNLKCFAHPPGLPGVQDGDFECVLIHDTAGNELLCYYYYNF